MISTYIKMNLITNLLPYQIEIKKIQNNFLKFLT
jgi:hypothetical protein